MVEREFWGFGEFADREWFGYLNVGCRFGANSIKESWGCENMENMPVYEEVWASN